MRDRFLGLAATVACLLGSVLSSATPAAAQTAPPAPAPAPALPVAAQPPLAPPPPPPPGSAPPAPPPYAYPPPPYGYAYPPPPYGYARPMVPATVPYEGGPVPPGFHVEERPRRGLIIAGAVVAGVPWAIGLAAVSSEDFPNGSGWLIVPGLGPWLTLAARHDTTCTYGSSSTGYSSTCVDFEGASRFLLVMDGLIQTAGVTMLIVGLASPKKVVARDFVGSLHLTPAKLSKDAYGGLLTGEF